MLGLVNEIAEKILGWKNVEGWWMRADRTRVKVATKSWHTWPEYFRPDKHVVHAWIVRDKLAELFGTKQETRFKGRTMIVAYETGDIVSEASDKWELGVGNELLCLAAMEHWKELHHGTIS